MARYMELLKLASLIERHPRPEELPAAIAEINSLITQTASAEQRQLYQESNLDELLLETERENLRRRKIVGDQSEISLEAYLPIRGGGLMLSATDIDVYRTCPLKYKFARVYNIPKEQTLPAAFRDPRAPGAGALPLAARQRGGAGRHRCDPRADAGQAHDAVRGGLAAARVQRLERGAPAAREGGRGAGALPRAVRRRAGLARLVRAQLLVPHRPAHAARSRGPRRPPSRRLVRADRLQDRPRAHAVTAEGRHPALALPDRREGVVEARLRAAELLLPARRRARAAGAVAGGRDPHHRHGDRGRDRASSTRSSSRSRHTAPARSATSS